MQKRDDESKTDIGVRATLKGEAKDRFLQIKKAKGLNANSEVVRILVMEYQLPQKTEKSKEDV